MFQVKIHGDGKIIIPMVIFLVLMFHLTIELFVFLRLRIYFQIIILFKVLLYNKRLYLYDNFPIFLTKTETYVRHLLIVGWHSEWL